MKIARNSHFGLKRKKFVKGRARRPAPTFLKITIILEFLHGFVGATTGK